MVYGGPETVLARLVGGRRPLVRFRGQLKDLATDPHSARERLGRQGLSTILAPSEVVAHTLRRPKGPPVRVIPLGCDTQKFYFDAEAFAALARPTLKILGRFDPVKGHRPFFGWFRQILRSWPQAIPPPYLEVVGEPANISREQLRGFARAAGLREGQDWRLLDRRFETMAPILSGTHVGVICSQDSEVICRVAEEFLLAGCPLFVSGVGSLEECLFDATAGVSYRELTPAEAIKSLKRLLIAAFQETAPIRRARAEAARQYFSTTMMGQNLARLVTELLSDRRRS
jgi:glycosyltransferase involved in cell wall biosynthesis